MDEAQVVIVSFVLLEDGEQLHCGNVLVTQETSQTCYGRHQAFEFESAGSWIEAELFDGIVIEHAIVEEAASLLLQVYRVRETVKGAVVPYVQERLCRLSVRIGKDSGKDAPEDMMIGDRFRLVFRTQTVAER